MPELQRVLLVEDSRDDRYIVTRRLRKQWPSIEIVEAANGFEALDALRRAVTPPDIILLDINMPLMNGHEFLEARSEGEDASIPPVVMLTSSDRPENMERARAFPCVRGYLIKPLKQSDLALLPAILAAMDSAE